MHRPTSARLRPFLAAVTALVLVAGLAQPAQAADTTTLSGTVSFGSAGAHPAGVLGRVTADVSMGGTSYTLGAATADADANGAYSITVPTNSWVRLRFSALQSGWQTQYYLNHDAMNLATVTAVGTTPVTGLDQTVPAMGSISGRVFLGSAATPASSGQVRVSWQVCIEEGCISGPPTTTLTDANGNYSFPSLYNGTYTLTFATTSGTTYQPPAPLSVVVSNSQTAHTGKDVTMPQAGSISGRVYLGSTATPAGAGTVTVTYSSGYSSAPLGSATTDASGAYVIPGLANGYYYLRFDYDGDAYADEWWEDTYGDRSARSVRIDGSGSATANAVLTAGGTISGRVTDGAGAAVAGTTVFARAYYGYVAGGDAYGFQYSTTTDSTGAYSLGGLPAGTYGVRFFDAGGQYPERRTDLTLAAGASRTADMQFFHGGHIDGYVTCAGCVDGVAGPRDDMSVSLETRATPSDPWVTAAVYSSISRSGYYSLYSVLPGEYRTVVSFRDGPYYTGRSTYPLRTWTAPFTLLEGQSRHADPISVPTSPNQIASLYADLGGAAGPLGAPVSAVVSFPDAGGGILQHYANGSIYSSYAGGTHVMWADAIRAAYWSSNSIFGPYGWPASDRSCDAGTCTMVFTKGMISLSPLAVTQAPSISGTAMVGGTLTVSPGAYSPTASAYTYAWFRDGTRIAGATSAKYSPVTADAGRVLTAEVTAARTGSYSAVTTTAPTAAVGPSAAMQITTRYASTGGPTGPLGPATTAIVAFPDNGGGSLQHYANGSIYSSNIGGTWTVLPGPIREVYWGANSIFSAWGWPAGDRDCSAGPCTQAFTGGTIAPAPLTVVSPPAVTGTPMVGGMLSAGAGAYSPAATSYTYAWLRDGATITGAVAATYIPTAEDLGHTLQVAVTAVRSTRVPVTTLSAASSPVGPGAPSLAPNPTVVGTARVGSPLSSTTGTWAAGTTWTYQWLAGGVPVVDAVGTTFTPGPAEFGKTITVRVVGSHPAYAPTTRTSTATAAVAAAAFTTAPLPTVDGTPQVGVPLTAVPGTWDPSATFAYQWYSNGTAITTARSSTFTPTGAQLGGRITVAVTGSSTGYTATTRTSTATAAVAAGSYAATPAPWVTGTAAIGSVLTASTAGWDTGTTFAYRWYSDGVPIAGATGSTFVPTATQLGESLTVRITTTTTGYPVVARESATGTAPIVRGSFAAAPAPVILGAVKSGSTLTASAGSWSPTATLVYQWYSDGNPVPGAEAATFVPRAAQVGTVITVRVVGAKAGLTSTTRTSAPTAPVAP